MNKATTLENKLATSIRDEDWSECLKCVMSGCDPNFRDWMGYTPLMLLSGKKNPDFAWLLLTAGANPEMTDSNGNTALLMACERGNFETVKVLLMRSDHLTTNDDGETALMFAIKSKSDEVFDLILSLQDSDSIRMFTMNYATAMDVADEFGTDHMKKSLRAKIESFEFGKEALPGVSKRRGRI